MYEILSESTKTKLISNEQPLLPDLVKNPILIKNTNKYTEISEKVLQQIILEDIKNFMQELGSGFSFVSNEYPIKLGDKYNYIDLLLYNYKYKCFVVIELKITKLKKEHTGQIQNYMNYNVQLGHNQETDYPHNDILQMRNLNFYHNKE